MTFTIPEEKIATSHHDDKPESKNKKLNIKETIAIIKEIP